MYREVIRTAKVLSQLAEYVGIVTNRARGIIIMQQKLEVRFECTYDISDPSVPGIKAFLEQTIPSLRVTRLRLAQKPKALRAVVESNLQTLVGGGAGFKVLASDLARLATEVSEFIPIGDGAGSRTEAEAEDAHKNEVQRLRHDINEMALEIANLAEENKELLLKVKENETALEFGGGRPTEVDVKEIVGEVLARVESIIAGSSALEDLVNKVVSEEKAGMEGVKKEVEEWIQSLKEHKLNLEAICKNANDKDKLLGVAERRASELVFDESESSLMLFQSEDEVRSSSFKEKLSAAERTAGELSELLKAKEREIAHLQDLEEKNAIELKKHQEEINYLKEMQEKFEQDACAVRKNKELALGEVNKELEAQRGKYETLHRDHDEVLKELIRLREELANLKDKAQFTMDKQSEVAVEEVTGLKEKLAKREETITGLKLKLKNDEEKLAQNEAVIAQLKEDAKKLETELHRREGVLREEVQKVKAQLDKAAKNEAALRETIRKHTEDAKRAKDSHDKLVRSEETVKRCMEKMQKTKEESDKLIKSETALKENLKKYMEDNQRLKGYIKESEESQREDIKKCMEEIKKVKEENDKLAKHNVALSEAVRRQAEEVQTLKLHNQELSKLESTLKEYIKKCTEKLQSVNAQKDALTKSQAFLREELKKCAEESQRTREENDRLKKAKTSLAEDIKKCTGEIQKIKSCNELEMPLKEELRKCISEMQAMRARNEELAKTEANLKEDVRRCGEEIKEKNERLAQSEAALKEVMDKHAEEMLSIKAQNKDLVKSEEHLKEQMKICMEEIEQLKVRNEELATANKETSNYAELKKNYDRLKSKLQEKSQAYDELVQAQRAIQEASKVHSFVVPNAPSEERKDCSKILQSKDEDEALTRLNTSPQGSEAAGSAARSAELETLQEKVRAYESLIGDLKAHELLAETLQMLNLKNIKLREDIEEALSYKEDYENIKKLNQNLSEELNSMKASAIWDSNKASQIIAAGDQEHSKLDKKIARKKKVIEEIKEYLKEILYVYGTLRNLIKERVVAIKQKQARISDYGSKIEEIKKLTNKDLQLKLIVELKESIPFMSALTLRKDNMKTMFLGIVAEGNARYSRLGKYAAEADKYNDIAKVIKERCPLFEAKLNAYEAATL